MFITTKSGVFKISEDESLLEVLEKHGYIVEYQCRRGYCGSCRLKLTQGQVCYKIPPLAFLQTDEILPCCCTVKEDLLIDISRSDHVKSDRQKSLFNFDNWCKNSSQTDSNQN